MTGPGRQRTRLEEALGVLAAALRGPFANGWRQGSLTVLALLLGFYLAQNLASLLLVRLPGGRPLLVLVLLLGFELLVRLRTWWVADADNPPLGWRVVDNLRLGATYAFVLEAFKLGT